MDSAGTENYIGNQAGTINKTLLNSKPPNEILRNPRPIEDRNVYKGIEFRNFALFYSPVTFANILSRRRYKHWLMFVNAMLLLSKKEITECNRHKPRLLIFNFIDLFPEIYGTVNVHYNVHLLIHLLERFENWGAPWASSAFLYEDVGGFLAKQVHGTTYVMEEITKKNMAGNSVRMLAGYFMVDANDNVQDLFAQLITRSVFKDGIPDETIGKPNLILFNPCQMLALHE